MDTDRTELFVQYFARHEFEIYAYIRTLLADRAAADDVMQEASIALWKKFDQFEPGTSFSHWARKVAFFEVLSYRARRQRDKLRFSDAFVDTVADRAALISDQASLRRQALDDCLARLNDRDRDLLDRCYQPGMDTRGVADDLNRPISSIYRSLGRIRDMLLDCIRRKLAHEEA